MIDWATLIGAAATVLLTAPAGYMAIKKKVEQSLFRRLEDISGGQVATLEDLVADALQQKRLKNSDIVVYGPSNLWAGAEALWVFLKLEWSTEIAQSHRLQSSTSTNS